MRSVRWLCGSDSNYKFIIVLSNSNYDIVVKNIG